MQQHFAAMDKQLAADEAARLQRERDTLKFEQEQQVWQGREQAAEAARMRESGEAVSGVPLDAQSKRELEAIERGQAVREGQFAKPPQAGRTLEERAVTDPVAREGLGLRADERARAFREQANFQNNITMGREERGEQRKIETERRSEDRARRKQQRTPIGAAAQKRIADFNAAIGLGNNLVENFDPRFVGFADNLRGKGEQFIGISGKAQTQFRRDAKNLVETYLRAMSGAAINEAEVKRIQDQAPRLSDSNEVFKDRLMSFLEHIERQRNSVIQTGTVERQFLKDVQPGISTFPDSQKVGMPEIPPEAPAQGAGDAAYEAALEREKQKLRDSGWTEERIEALVEK